MNHVLSGLFSIHEPTPIKLIWVAITLINVAFMIILAWRKGPPGFRIYMAVMAACALVQASSVWNMAGEIILALAGALFVAEMLPERQSGVVFSIAIGVVSIMALLHGLPSAYGTAYPSKLYFTRLYTTTALLGATVGSVILSWFGGDGIRWRAALALPWFGAVLFSSMMLGKFGLGRWTIAIIANVTWTTCLAGWVWMGRRNYNP